MFATTADGAGMRWVSFYDNSQCIGSSRTYVVPDALVDVPTAQMYWVPSTAGRHVLTADDGQTTKTITVDVQPTPTGSTPSNPGPQPSGCSALDRLFNAGSSNLLGS
ncbi:hypothetical protein ACWDNI_35570 [Nocardia niigatensis]